MNRIRKFLLKQAFKHEKRCRIVIGSFISHEQTGKHKWDYFLYHFFEGLQVFFIRKEVK